MESSGDRRPEFDGSVLQQRGHRGEEHERLADSDAFDRMMGINVKGVWRA
jgi:hypothetical protein